MLALIVVSVFVAMIAGVNIAARHFAREQQRKGRWDDEGPLVETEGPPNGFQRGSMNERLEVIGKWVPPVVKDRRRPNTDHRDK